MYFDTFVKLGLSYFPDNDIASDIAQETMIKAWLNKETYNEKYSLYTWLSRIFNNTAIDYKRSVKGNGKEKRTWLRDSDNVFQNFVSPSINVDAIDLQSNLKKIRLKYRFTIYHHYLLGYTHNQIAEKFGMSLGEVKNNIRQGLKELRKIYC